MSICYYCREEKQTYLTYVGYSNIDDTLCAQVCNDCCTQPIEDKKDEQ